MHRLLVFVSVFVGAVYATNAPLLAQATTGSISGRLLSSDQQPLPGATVTVTSPALQGVRAAVTSASGDYLIPLLPPGIYSISFELSGFQSVTRTQFVASGYHPLVDLTMSLEAVSEDVTVVADAQPLTDTAQVATNFKQDLMATLPSNRTIDAVMLMAPSVHATGPNGAFSIAGALSYENVYTVNGAVIVENLRGTPYPLYIEDAVQEVTVSTAGVSAEYGRFTGGMVSVITRSGGDTFSGSLRTSFANDFWRTKTPSAADPKRDKTLRESDKPDTVPMYEATFGGPVKKQHLWFFGATRIRDEQTGRKTTGTNLFYLRGNYEKRYEGKLTFAPAANHSFHASYIAIDQIQTNFSPQSIRVMDLNSLTEQKQPSDLIALRYGGVVSPNLSVEVQYSARHLTLDTGARSRDRIDGTVLIDSLRNNRYWSPTFCGVCEDEKRDNEDFTAKGTYFLTSSNGGAHHLVFGYDRFNDKVFQNAYQSGSDYRIVGTTAILPGDGSVFPQFLPNSTQIWWTPVDVKSLGSNLRMHSVFANDSWRANDHLTLNIGVRWDKNQGQDGGGEIVANRSLISPRLAAIWDPNGEGRWAVNANYARYVMPMTSNVAASTTRNGNAAAFIWLYQGPAINPDSNAPVVTSAVAIQRVFEWFERNGGTQSPKVGSFVPGVNIRIVSPLKSPNADEFAAGTNRQLGTRGTLRVDAVWRAYHDFYSQRADLTTGRVTDPERNRYDLFVVENTNGVKRRYSALITQASYRIADRIDVGGNYTLSRTWGNFDGETTSGGPSVAQVTAYPEYKSSEWNTPEGDLAVDQRHSARVWGTYHSPALKRYGALSFGILQQIGSGVPYGAVAPINGAASIPNPGYEAPLSPNGLLDYYFTARDAFRTDTTYRTDLSINYAYRLHAGDQHPELFFHGEVLNVFRDFQICGCGGSAFGNGGTTDLTTIGQAVRTSRNTTGLSTFNPLTTEPVNGTNWALTPEFGRPLSYLAYTTPRLYRFSVGVRF